MRPPLFLTACAALALALFPTRAEEPAPPVADSVVVDAPTEAVLNGALRYLADGDIAIRRNFIASMMAG